MKENEMEEVIREFLIESHENLDQIDQDLVRLEKDPSRREVFDKIFRTLHTIKGSCSFLGYSKLEAVAHNGENLLDALRSGEVQLNAEITSTLLEVMDAVRRILREIEESREEGTEDYTGLVSRLQEHLAGASKAGSTAGKVDEQSIYFRIGGRESVIAAVDGFYERVLNDPELRVFFKDTNMNALKNMQVQFFFQALGGPAGYKGKELKAAHAHLGIERRHFDRVMIHLVATLQGLGVSPSIVEEIREAVEGLAPAIISSGGKGEKGSGLSRQEDKRAEGLAGPAGEEVIAPGGGMGVVGKASGESGLDAKGDVPAEEHHSKVAETTIRVEVELLDKLMTLVGEMVLARNQVLQFADSSEDAGFLATVQRLNLITSELQEAAMKTRMQPIGNIWGRFPRMVRDLSLNLGKKVRLELEGRETELDKSIIEAIRDPLTHLVRNAVDHGIERPENREKSGKSAEGKIALRAFHEGGNVNIEITDNGAGIHPGRVKQKAVERGVISAQQAEGMSEQQLLNLIFLPGFSLAENVTNLSGRGVGMDVVRSNLEKVSGTVEVNSRVGEGTVFKIKIPLTLAIIPALVVNCNGDYYSIPQVSLLELVRFERGDGSRGVEMVHGAPVYRLRGDLLPLVFLDSVLEGKGSYSQEAVKGGNGVVNIVVLQADDKTFGLVVEGINDTEEIVVKPLGKRLKGITCFAGAAIRGDGRVALILDVPGLARHTRVVAEATDQTLMGSKAGVQEQTKERTTLLLFSVGSGRMGIPLSMVARLEEFPVSKLEFSGEQEVMQYRGEIMPLIRVSEVLQDRRARPRSAERTQGLDGEELLQVVVYNKAGRSVGIVVDHILDIVQDHLKIQQESSRKGVRGSVVIQDRVTELIDVEGLIEKALPGFSRREMAVKGEG